MFGKILPKMWMVWCLFMSTAVIENTSLSPDNDLYEKINYNIYGVEPHSTILPRVYINLITKKHPAYSVHNIGREKVVAKNKFGDLLRWIGDISVATVLPNKRVTLNSNGTYIRTGLEIRNNEAIRAIVYVEGGNPSLPNRPPPGFDSDRVLRKAFKYSAKFIPYYHGGLSAILKNFWPNKNPSIWERVINPVKQLLDYSTQLFITNVLRQKIDYMQTRMQLLYNETKSRSNGKSVSVRYMNIAQDLDRLENIFQVNKQATKNSEWINTVTIGLFTTTVSLKVNFYALGIINPNFFNLTFNEIKTVKNYLKTTLHGPEGAIAYIRNSYTQQVENCYKTCYAGVLYDSMINIRSHIALQGLESIPLWIAAEKHPVYTEQPYVDVISYSEFFGRPTSNLFSVATGVNMRPPLTPELMANGKRRKLLSIKMFIWRLNGTGPARVGGASLIFDGNRTYTMGTTTTQIEILNLNGANIVRIRVFGKGQVDKLVFYLSDRRIVSFGSANHKNYKDFQLLDHHIVSIFIASDDRSLHGQAANFAVSYRLN